MKFSHQVVLGGFASAAVLTQKPLYQTSLDDYIHKESPVALENLLCNVGPDGCRAKGASPGAVIASPSTDDPDYFFTWTRDSALVYKLLLELGQGNANEYVAAQRTLQGTPNLAGGLDNGLALGEAKFQVNLTQFKEPWGRPQRDGPALRAITTMAHARELVAKNDMSGAREVWPVIQNDLNYVAQYWNHKGFDLWEEVEGSSFFTALNQYRALVEGTTLARKLGLACPSCDIVAPHLLCFVQSFWDDSEKYMRANIHAKIPRTGIDANTVLASIHAFDPEIGCDEATFQPCSAKALSSLKVYIDSFRDVYDINHGRARNAAIAVGRYAEDIYYGGNPWYLTTLAVAEQIYDAIYVWEKHGRFEVTEMSHAFFADHVSDITVGVHAAGSSPHYPRTINSLRAYADSFISVVERYTGESGQLDEQFGGQDGVPISARHLTWSYAAFLSATLRRDGIVPEPWVQPENKLPETCHEVTVAGYYSYDDHLQPLAAVTFKLEAETVWGESIVVAGDSPSFGKWNNGKALALNSFEYKVDNKLWQVTAMLPKGSTLRYKFLRRGVNHGGRDTWERRANRELVVPEDVDTLTVHDTWGH